MYMSKDLSICLYIKHVGCSLFDNLNRIVGL